MTPEKDDTGMALWEDAKAVNAEHEWLVRGSHPFSDLFHPFGDILGLINDCCEIMSIINMCVSRLKKCSRLVWVGHNSASFLSLAFSYHLKLLHFFKGSSLGTKHVQ